MKIVNPKYKPEAQMTKTEKRLAYLKGLVDIFLNSLPVSVEFIDFDYVRSWVDGLNYSDEFGPLRGADLTDAVIQALAASKNIKVVP